MNQIKIKIGSGSLASAVLLAGWLTLRANWSFKGTLKRKKGNYLIEGHNQEAQKLSFLLIEKEKAIGCGAIDEVTFDSDDLAITLDHCATSDRYRDVLTGALRPIPLFAHGYQETLETIAPVLKLK